MSAINELMKWVTKLTGFGALAMGAMAGYYSLRIIATGDEGMVSQYKVRLKNVFIAAVILTSITGIVYFVLVKFGVSSGSIDFIK